jgi:hypothetical protein
MADGGIQGILKGLGASVRVDEAKLTPEEDKEYGGWKRLGMALGHFADIVTKNERDGHFTVGLLATCPSMPGLVAGLQRSGPTHEALRIGMLWLDAHPDFNTPETTRSGSLGGMPVAVATGRALTRMRLDAKLEPALPDRYVVMGGVRLTDPLEQQMLDESRIEQVSVDDLRKASPAVFQQLDRLAKITDKIYIHIDMDVLDPAEVMGHGNKVPNAPRANSLPRSSRRSSAATRRRRDRLRHDSGARRGRAVSRRRQSDDRRRGPRGDRAEAALSARRRRRARNEQTAETRRHREDRLTGEGETGENRRKAFVLLAPREQHEWIDHCPPFLLLDRPCPSVFPAPPW